MISNFTKNAVFLKKKMAKKSRVRLTSFFVTSLKINYFEFKMIKLLENHVRHYSRNVFSLNLLNLGNIFKSFDQKVPINAKM